MKLTDKVSIAPQVVARMVGSETVILDLASGIYFGLDPIGAKVWTLLEGGKSIAEVCVILLDEYDAPRDMLERDALALVGQLLEKNLVSIA